MNAGECWLALCKLLCVWHQYADMVLGIVGDHQHGAKPQQDSKVDGQEDVADLDWAKEHETEREAVAAGQQLARDNSQALREVRQAMQAESDRPGRQLQQEDESQDDTSLSRIQESEREALAAGQQLAEDNMQALREIRLAMQGESAFPMTVFLQRNCFQPVQNAGQIEHKEPRLQCLLVCCCITCLV